MAALNLLFLLGLFFGVYAIISSLLLAILTLFRVRRKIVWFVAAFALQCSCLAIYAYLMLRPEAIFERQFGFPPSAQVQSLTASQYVLGDGGSVSISFAAHPSILDKIVIRGMKRVEDVGTARHYTRNFSGNFGIENEDLFYYEQKGYFEYTWMGID